MPVPFVLTLTGQFYVTTSAQRLAGTRGGGTNAIDIDPGLTTMTLANFAS